ncbi:DUF1361 domain-containing protein [Brevibacillus sp. B_LB10_24]|uniref:DUF1361 domain-containing protein n=1 Tax=Brevibacillus sp. B_LB10_24 TaxID=3380645 RepID=UPI0038BC741E
MNERNKARISFFLYILLLLVFDTRYWFMILNMFLAFAALELSFLLPLFTGKSKKELPLNAFFYTVFILLSPNIFYVVTDLIHLNMFPFKFRQGLVLHEWWNFSVLTCGVLLAVYYFVLMHKQLQLLLSRLKWKKLIFLLFVLLSSIGIYIGRFLRFHTIHVFTEPLSVIRQFMDSVNGDSLLFIVYLSVLQLLVCWLFLDARGAKHD